MTRGIEAFQRIYDSRRRSRVFDTLPPLVEPQISASIATHYRGMLLIQAAANLPPRRDFEESCAFARRHRIKLPEKFDTGGIIGMVELADCVAASRSKWFTGPVGWVLKKPKKIQLIPLKGQLGLFDPPQSVRAKLRRILGEL